MVSTQASRSGFHEQFLTMSRPKCIVHIVHLSTDILRSIKPYAARMADYRLSAYFVLYRFVFAAANLLQCLAFEIRKLYTASLKEA